MEETYSILTTDPLLTKCFSEKKRVAKKRANQDYRDVTDVQNEQPTPPYQKRRRCMESSKQVAFLAVKDNKVVQTNWDVLKQVPYFSTFYHFLGCKTQRVKDVISSEQDIQDMLDLKEFDETTVGIMLSFIKDGHCHTDIENVSEVLHLADYLRIESLIKYCISMLHTAALEDQISMSDVHDIIVSSLQGIDRFLVFNLCDVAVEKCYMPLIKEGLNLGMNPNFAYEDLRKQKTGYNIFFKAVSSGHYDITNLLISAGANVNFQIINPRTMSIYDERDTPWIENFQAMRQRYFFSRDVYSQCQPNRGSTCLHASVWNNHINITKLLIDNGARIQADHDGETPVHFAAALGQLDTLRYFVSQVYQGLFNIHSNIMGTPLFRAVLSSNINVIKYMIEQGADLTQTDYTGFTIISYAAVANNLHVVRYLHEMCHLPLCEQNDTQETLLHQCASLGHLDVSRYCVEHDPSLLHIQDERGDTPLHVAVLYDQMPIAKLLINTGSSVNLANYLNEHPLHIALMENCNEIIPTLLEAGADPNAVLNIRDTATPLTLAIMCGGDSTYEYVKLLLKSGANPRLLHDKALILALRENINHKNEIIQVLLEYHGNPNARYMGTPVLLDVCAMPNSIHLVNLLLSKGVQVNAVNRQGQTALMVACAKDYKDYVEILLKHGADPSKASWYGLTASMIAKESNLPSSHIILDLLTSYSTQSNNRLRNTVV